KCALKNALIISINSFVSTLSQPFQEALPQAFSKAMPNQEQEQEQKQEQDQEQKKEKRLMSGKPDVDPFFDEQIHYDHQSKDSIAVLKSQAIEILQFLNEKTGRIYRPVDTN